MNLKTKQSDLINQSNKFHNSSKNYEQNQDQSVKNQQNTLFEPDSEDKSIYEQKNENIYTQDSFQSKKRSNINTYQLGSQNIWIQDIQIGDLETHLNTNIIQNERIEQKNMCQFGDLKYENNQIQLNVNQTQTIRKGNRNNLQQGNLDQEKYKQQIIEYVGKLQSNKSAIVDLQFSENLQAFIITKKTFSNQEEFEREIQILNKLQNKEVTLQLIETDEKNLKFQQIAGKASLYQFKQKGELINVFYYFYFILIDKLNKMHESGIAHSDIKPQNIVISFDNVPYFIDFGASIFLSDERDYENYLTQFTARFNLKIFFQIFHSEPKKQRSKEEIKLCDKTQLSLTFLFLLCYNQIQLDFFNSKQYNQLFQNLLQNIQNIDSAYLRINRLIVLNNISQILNLADSQIEIIKIQEIQPFFFSEWMLQKEFNDTNDIILANNIYYVKIINQLSIWMIYYLYSKGCNLEIQPQKTRITPLPELEQYKIISREFLIDEYFIELSYFIKNLNDISIFNILEYQRIYKIRQINFQYDKSGIRFPYEKSDESFQSEKSDKSDKESCIQFPIKKFDQSFQSKKSDENSQYQRPDQNFSLLFFQKLQNIDKKQTFELNIDCDFTDIYNLLSDLENQSRFYVKIVVQDGLRYFFQVIIDTKEILQKPEAHLKVLFHEYLDDWDLEQMIYYLSFQQIDIIFQDILKINVELVKEFTDYFQKTFIMFKCPIFFQFNFNKLEFLRQNYVNGLINNYNLTHQTKINGYKNNNNDNIKIYMRKKTSKLFCNFLFNNQLARLLQYICKIIECQFVDQNALDYEFLININLSSIFSIDQGLKININIHKGFLKNHKIMFYYLQTIPNQSQVYQLKKNKKKIQLDGIQSSINEQEQQKKNIIPSQKYKTYKCFEYDLEKQNFAILKDTKIQYLQEFSLSDKEVDLSNICDLNFINKDIRSQNFYRRIFVTDQNNSMEYKIDQDLFYFRSQVENIEAQSSFYNTLVAIFQNNIYKFQKKDSISIKQTINYRQYQISEIIEERNGFEDHVLFLGQQSQKLQKKYLILQYQFIFNKESTNDKKIKDILSNNEFYDNFVQFQKYCLFTIMSYRQLFKNKQIIIEVDFGQNQISDKCFQIIFLKIENSFPIDKKISFRNCQIKGKTLLNIYKTIVNFNIKSKLFFDLSFNKISYDSLKKLLKSIQFSSLIYKTYITNHDEEIIDQLVEDFQSIFKIKIIINANQIKLINFQKKEEKGVESHPNSDENMQIYLELNIKSYSFKNIKMKENIPFETSEDDEKRNLENQKQNQLERVDLIKEDTNQNPLEYFNIIKQQFNKKQKLQNEQQIQLQRVSFMQEDDNQNPLECSKQINPTQIVQFDDQWLDQNKQFEHVDDDQKQKLENQYQNQKTKNLINEDKTQHPQKCFNIIDLFLEYFQLQNKELKQNKFFNTSEDDQKQKFEINNRADKKKQTKNKEEELNQECLNYMDILFEVFQQNIVNLKRSKSTLKRIFKTENLKTMLRNIQKEKKGSHYKKKRNKYFLQYDIYELKKLNISVDSNLFDYQKLKELIQSKK